MGLRRLGGESERHQGREGYSGERFEVVHVSVVERLVSADNLWSEAREELQERKHNYSN
jgi:hypothetical protein